LVTGEYIVQTLRNIAKKIPLLPSLYRQLRARFGFYRLISKSTNDVFSDIFKHNSWGGADSVSGPGSDACQTKIITHELPVLFKALNVSTVLDIPCGDFNWMKDVNLKNITYTGADIVQALIETNNSKYSKEGIGFRNLDLIRDKLPKVDLIFCRDCLVHLSFADIKLALANICASQSEYFLTTTFPERKKNYNIVTGQWRVINLEVSPFTFPQPIRIINEGCTEGNGIYKDKSLGLWRIADIKGSLVVNKSNK
jgi:hypothetical protein